MWSREEVLENQFFLFKMRRDEETQTLQAVKGPSIIETVGLEMRTILEREKEVSRNESQGMQVGSEEGPEADTSS